VSPSRSELDDLIFRYAWAADTDDVEGIAACFTVDGTFATNTGAVPCSGRDAIKEFFSAARRRRAEAGQKTRHLMGSLLFQEEAGAVRARSYLILVTTQPDGSTAVECSGEYRDRIVKVDGAWLFAEREIVFDATPVSLTR
jgi:uncharacterized protein (TIGR02246 family)